MCFECPQRTEAIFTCLQDTAVLSKLVAVPSVVIDETNRDAIKSDILLVHLTEYVEKLLTTRESNAQSQTAIEELNAPQDVYINAHSVE